VKGVVSCSEESCFCGRWGKEGGFLATIHPSTCHSEITGGEDGYRSNIFFPALYTVFGISNASTIFKNSRGSTLSSISSRSSSAIDISTSPPAPPPINMLLGISAPRSIAAKLELVRESAGELAAEGTSKLFSTVFSASPPSTSIFPAASVRFHRLATSSSSFSPAPVSRHSAPHFRPTN
jgi:hypothetical protein